MSLLPPAGFTGSPLDRTDENRPNDDQIAAWRVHPDARVLLLEGLDPGVTAQGGLLWQPMSAIESGEPIIFLGLDEGRPRFTASRPVREAASHPMAVLGLVPAMPAGDPAIYAAARSLTDWHRRHGFCANCGAVTRAIKGGWARLCDACGTEHFPRTDPVVIMLAVHGGRVLLGRQHRFPPGRYSALAGFVEVGESIEEAVARELREEAGVIVTNVRYVASQPWPFPSSLMIGCFAEVESDAISLDANELEHAFWATPAEVRAALAGEGAFGVPPPYAVGHTLLARWVGAA